MHDLILMKQSLPPKQHNLNCHIIAWKTPPVALGFLKIEQPSHTACRNQRILVLKQIIARARGLEVSGGGQYKHMSESTDTIDMHADGLEVCLCVYFLKVYTNLITSLTHAHTSMYHLCVYRTHWNDHLTLLGFAEMTHSPMMIWMRRTIKIHSKLLLAFQLSLLIRFSMPSRTWQLIPIRTMSTRNPGWMFVTPFHLRRCGSTSFNPQSITLESLINCKHSFCISNLVCELDRTGSGCSPFCRPGTLDFKSHEKNRSLPVKICNDHDRCRLIRLFSKWEI